MGSPADLAVALECFAYADYVSESLSPKRVAKEISGRYMEANGHSLTRYLWLCPRFSVTLPDLKLKLAERLM